MEDELLAAVSEDELLVVATPDVATQNVRWESELSLALDRLAAAVGVRPTVKWESYRFAGTTIILVTLSSQGKLHHVSLNIVGYTDLPKPYEGPFDYGVADAVDALFVMSMLLKRLGVEELPLVSFG